MKLFTLLSIHVVLAASQANSACKLLPGDAKWPAIDVWKSALPGVVALEKSQEEGLPRRPDYQLVATTIEQVQAAVKFTSEHNIRLTILNSGVDFLGRYERPKNLFPRRGSSSTLDRCQKSFSVLSNQIARILWTLMLGLTLHLPKRERNNDTTSPRIGQDAETPQI